VDIPENSNDELLVIDGQVDLSAAGSTVRISRTDDLGSSQFLPVADAQITLIDEDGNQAGYSETEPGVYELNTGSISIVVGGTYFIEVTTPDGKQYRSRPETIPTPIPIQDISYEFNNLAIQVFAETTRTDADTPTFFKWAVEVVYQVSEFFCGGLDSVNICYLDDFSYFQQIVVFDASSTSPGSTIKRQVAEKVIDYSFGEKQVFSVYQSTLTEDAYRYFDALNTVTNNTGNFFDIQPAAVRGNLFNVEDEQEIVLGYFSAVSLDTLRLSINPVHVPANIRALPYCGAPGIRPWPWPPACCACLLLENSTLEKPPYWD